MYVKMKLIKAREKVLIPTITNKRYFDNSFVIKPK